MIVSRQMKLHPTYTIVTSGHSLGGVLALFAAVTLQLQYPAKYAYSENFEVSCPEVLLF